MSAAAMRRLTEHAIEAAFCAADKKEELKTRVADFYESGEVF